MSETQPDARPAATLIVARENSAGAPHFLMAERSGSMNFAAGALVFPGGAVDEEDRAFARSVAAADVEDFAARIAAIRETIEESGLALASVPPPPQLMGALRAALGAGRSLAAASAELGLAFDFEGLVPFARWCPPARGASRRYDTRFYIGVAGAGHDFLTPDGSETTGLAWHTAREVLDRADAGDAKIIFPTRRNLERLAQFGTVAELIGHARAYPVSTISPWIEKRDGVDHLCIPEDIGYPVTSERLDSAIRG